MSIPHKETKHHELCVNPQHINASNPVNEETIKSQQAKTNMIIFSTENSCILLIARMQNKENISSYIQYWYGLISLAKSRKSIENTVY